MKQEVSSNGKDIEAILTYGTSDSCELLALDMSLESFTAEIAEALAPMRPATRAAISSMVLSEVIRVELRMMRAK